jgi:hypothetical protein
MRRVEPAPAADPDEHLRHADFVRRAPIASAYASDGDRSRERVRRSMQSDCPRGDFADALQRCIALRISGLQQEKRQDERNHLSHPRHKKHAAPCGLSIIASSVVKVRAGAPAGFLSLPMSWRDCGDRTLVTGTYLSPISSSFAASRETKMAGSAARPFELDPGLRRDTSRSIHLTSSTCSNSSSTGVARPKIETATFTRPFSKSSSSTSPLKLANGPSSTFTLSPIS